MISRQMSPVRVACAASRNDVLPAVRDRCLRQLDHINRRHMPMTRIVSAALAASSLLAVVPAGSQADYSEPPGTLLR